MSDLEIAFWGFTLADLMLAAGRYLLLVSASLLVVKNVAWIVRWGGSDRRFLRKARIPIETGFAIALVVIYGHHLYGGGSDLPAAVAALSRWESGLVAWVVAGILITLVLTRKDDRPSEYRDVQEHHHAHDLQEHHHEHEHRSVDDSEPP